MWLPAPNEQHTQAETIFQINSPSEWLANRFPVNLDVALDLYIRGFPHANLPPHSRTSRNIVCIQSLDPNLAFAHDPLRCVQSTVRPVAFSGSRLCYCGRALLDELKVARADNQ